MIGRPYFDFRISAMVVFPETGPPNINILFGFNPLYSLNSLTIISKFEVNPFLLFHDSSFSLSFS
jgi:hypothetical protein